MHWLRSLESLLSVGPTALPLEVTTESKKRTMLIQAKDDASKESLQAKSRGKVIKSRDDNDRRRVTEQDLLHSRGQIFLLSYIIYGYLTKYK